MSNLELYSFLTQTHS